MKDHYLKVLLKGNNEEKVQAVEYFRRNESLEAVPFLLDILKKTEDKKLRNALAIALGDLKVTDVVPVLWELIRRPNLINSRGTLIYALRNFDCSNYIVELCEVICEGNFESREMALQIIEDLETEVDLDLINRAINVLIECNERLEFDDAKKQYVEAALSILKEAID